MCLSQQLQRCVCLAILWCAIDCIDLNPMRLLNIASYLASAQELMYAPNSQWEQTYKGSEPPVISK
jgi:hypothetical protein